MVSGIMRKLCTLLHPLALILTGTLACSLAAAKEPELAPAWPTLPSILHLPSEYGTLHIAINDYVHESALQIDNQPITPEVRGLLNITYAFKMPDAQAALVSINSGNDTCPLSYRWVLLRSNGHLVSPAFGSCSEKIRVSTEGKTLKIETPNQADQAKIDVYSYSGGTTVSRTTIVP